MIIEDSKFTEYKCIPADTIKMNSYVRWSQPLTSTLGSSGSWYVSRHYSSINASGEGEKKSGKGVKTLSMAKSGH